ncbi:zinc finger protein RFP-like [Ambystoma mexicanum]|uniref:zinc finger protein RFP-like n=1 Tax=Ambystoma mexicanum TaxID=8296 RepID=UPI0037E71CF4
MKDHRKRLADWLEAKCPAAGEKKKSERSSKTFEGAPATGAQQKAKHCKSAGTRSGVGSGSSAARQCAMSPTPSSTSQRSGSVKRKSENPGEVTLDSGTAHPRLIVSADGRSVRWGPQAQDLPDTPQRFTTHPCVLGREGLSSGRHYWEVEVGGSPGWTLGVCDESVPRKGKITASPAGGFWTVRLLWDGKYWALTSPATPLTPRAPPRVLGLFLDYEAGRLSVYDAQDRVLLFTFPGAPFPRTLRPYFRTVSTEGGLRILLGAGGV